MTRRQSGRRGLLTPRHVDLPFLHTLFTAVRTALVTALDSTHGFTAWGMLGNGPDPTLTINDGNPVGDCFFAAVCHILMLKALIQNDSGQWIIDPKLVTQILPTADRWVGLYLGYQNGLPPGQTATTGPDNGTEPVAGFQWLMKAGIIKRWGVVDLAHLDEANVDHAAVLLACALDEDAEQEFENHQPWLERTHDPIEGGHAIGRAGFTTLYGLELTWGADEQAAHAWEKKHVQQAYWLQAPWEEDAAGYDFGPLDAALAVLPDHQSLLEA